MSDQIRVYQVLIVEDNIGHIRLIEEAFKTGHLQYELTALQDGIEAMNYLQQQENYPDAIRPDLILLDLNLPCKDGREVLAEVKTDPDLKSIPILVLTTSTKEEDIQQSYELHANCFITKSGDVNQLFEMVRRIEEFWLQTVTLPRETLA